MWLAAVRSWRSELEEAEAGIRQAIDELRLWGFGEVWLRRGFLISILVRRGDLEEARRCSRAATSRRRRPRPPGIFHQAKLELLAAEGRDAEALATAELLERGFAHVRNPATATWRSLRAPLRHRAGDVEGALADLDEELALARTWGAPGPIGRVLRIRGELLGDAAQLGEAVAILADSTVRLEHARALLALGRNLRLDRRPTEAREPLREALAVAAACGAPGLVAEVRAELGAAGVRPRNEALTGPGALTPSERRIAELAAGGLTNRDIAQQLFVTPKTVEVHLSAVYRKLGITSRRAAAGRDGRRPLGVARTETLGGRCSAAPDGGAAAIAEGAPMTESIWFTDSLIRIHVTPEDTDGAYALLEILAPSGHVTPPHIHERDAESFLLLEGEITLHTNDGPHGRAARPGRARPRRAGRTRSASRAAARRARVVVSAPSGFVDYIRACGRPAEREALPTLDGPPDVALLRREAPAHGMTVLGAPGALPADLVARV